MTKRIDRNRLPRISCPDCGGKTIVRSSAQVTDIVRELRVNCDSDECRARYVVQLAFISVIQRGARPNPAVRLPFAPLARPANDDNREPANDVEPPLEAASTDPMSG